VEPDRKAISVPKVSDIMALRLLRRWARDRKGKRTMGRAWAAMGI